MVQANIHTGCTWKEEEKEGNMYWLLESFLESAPEHWLKTSPLKNIVPWKYIAANFQRLKKTNKQKINNKTTIMKGERRNRYLRARSIGGSPNWFYQSDNVECILSHEKKIYLTIKHSPFIFSTLRHTVKKQYSGHAENS